MKKFAAIWLLLALPSCALGKLEDAADALEEAEKTLDELDVSSCMDVCSEQAEVCLEDANGPCVDNCELDEDSCDAEQEACIDQNKVNCSNLSGPAYTACYDGVLDFCDLDCEGQAGDCIQGCGEQAQECLVGNDETVNAPANFSDCMSACIKEMEDELKGIDL